MSDPVHGGDAARVRQVEIEITRVPTSGTIRVVFLGDMVGTYLHWMGKKFLPCEGELCAAATHKAVKDWRAFAAVHLWQKGPPPFWYPTVLEITDRLRIFLGHDPLRATMWDLWRRPGRRDKHELYGEHRQDLDPRTLRPPFDVKRAVERMYRCSRMVWDVAPLFTDPEMVEIVEIQPTMQKVSQTKEKAKFQYKPSREGMTMRQMVEEEMRMKASFIKAQQEEGGGA